MPYKILKNGEILISYDGNVKYENKDATILKKLDALYRDKKYDDILKNILPSYDKNIEYHNYYLGIAYYFKSNNVEDYKKSAKYVRRSKDDFSKFLQATMLHYGIGIKKNLKFAAECYAKASNSCPDALYGLYLMFKNGDYFDKNEEISQSFLKQWVKKQWYCRDGIDANSTRKIAETFLYLNALLSG